LARLIDENSRNGKNLSFYCVCNIKLCFSNTQRFYDTKKLEGETMKYVVALDFIKTVPCVFLAGGEGDPARTCIMDNAEQFTCEGNAYIALGHVMNSFPFRNFERAKVIQV
jgi:hypothetical protein